MRQVKCRNCGKFFDRDKAIVIERGKAKLFYCSEECEEKAKEQEIIAQKKENEKDAVYNEICDIFGYKITNTALWKEWAVWNQAADNTKILAYLKENKEYLTGVIGRLSSGEYPRIRYISSILKNSLHDYKVKVVEEEKSTPKIEQNMNEMMYEIHNTKKNKRQSLEDLEDVF